MACHQITQLQHIYSNSMTYIHAINVTGISDSHFLTTSSADLSIRYYCREQEDSDQGHSHDDKPHFPCHLPCWMLTNSKPRSRAPPSTLFQSHSFPQANCLPPPCLCPTGKHTFNYIHLHSNFQLKNKWIKS